MNWSTFPRTTLGMWASIQCASRPPGGIHIARQCVPQCLGMLGVQVDLILRAVEPEADGTLSFTAVEVIDEQGLYLLSHDSSITSR